MIERIFFGNPVVKSVEKSHNPEIAAGKRSFASVQHLRTDSNITNVAKYVEIACVSYGLNSNQEPRVGMARTVLACRACRA